MNQKYLRPSRFIDSDHPDIVELVRSLVDSTASDQANAVALYYWARDEIRYNPYSVGGKPDDYLASTTLRTGESWCVPKALLLAAMCRAAGIPARVGFADVRNHLSTERMREMMETDLFYFHGYTSVFLNGQWVKATPAFNIELCDRFGLLPLEFDGTQDSLYHSFDRAGNRHMEYVNDRGEHLDLPYDEMMGVFRLHYPKMMQALGAADMQPQQWNDDVDSEVQKQPLPAS
ncbi:transglutaminase-like domain-containing protein [Pseudohalioglobus lutimaris]|uniref:Transglutaminase family protein n=1 Tax=Pseudohalioglobus lutimaris TaxID=1737061 RepID=A0A2N5WYT8_9GAMM|nr:transglutaminase family protein [Pseudohalioglobus lutimaris]PLW67390.1 transglutaminase family protein [Pseudohalioglobus lutimaris]